MMSEIKNIKHNAIKIESKKVLIASFFNSGSISYGFLFLYTVIK